MRDCAWVVVAEQGTVQTLSCKSQDGCGGGPGMGQWGMGAWPVSLLCYARADPRSLRLARSEGAFPEAFQ
eukprot:5228792-Prymnesium_polylepis.1